MLYLRQGQGPGTPCVKIGLFCQDGLRLQVPAESALPGIQSQLEVGWRSREHSQSMSTALVSGAHGGGLGGPAYLILSRGLPHRFF